MRHIVIILLLSCATLAQAAVPAFSEVKNNFRSSYAELLDRRGEFLHARRIDMQVNRLAWVELKDLSPALLEAVVFAEDRDFYSHRGIDWGATARASWQLLQGDRSRGASTITMQLAGLIDTELAWRSGGRSLAQKWRQMRAARRLEKTWSKPEILEAWLNLVTFRGDLQGVAAASHALFGKAPAGLNRHEALLLAALLPAPGATPARVAQRACALITTGFSDANCQSVRDLAFIHLARRLAPYPENPALESVSASLLTEAGKQLRSTLDAMLQREAQEILADQLAELRARNVNAGAVLVLDNASGEVRAYVANAGLVESARFVDGVQALRQAGSTLKPFLYALALDKRYLTAASVLEDAPLSLSTPNGLYVPQNYDKDFKGPMSARVALAGSLNIPAVRTLTLVGVEDFWQQLRRLGLSSLTEAPEFYGYALALGSADVNLWTLTNAYRALANQGRYSAAMLRAADTQSAEPVLGAAASFVISDILADRGARAVTFGLENPLALPFQAAVKTGTSKDMRDNWCIGFSSRYTVGVWVGNLDGTPMHDVSGISGAAPVWAALMQRLEGGQIRPGGEYPAPPAGMRRQRVEFAGLREPPREEWFLDGTEMTRVEFVAEQRPRILYPAAGTVVAIDPDIPEMRQRLRFRAAAADGADWWLNTRRLGPARDLEWRPEPGVHHLSLRNAGGETLDTVVFTVRGARRRD